MAITRRTVVSVLTLLLLLVIGLVAASQVHAGYSDDSSVANVMPTDDSHKRFK